MGSVFSYSQVKNPKNLPYTWTTDTTKHTVDLHDLTIAVEKDALPTLDFPKLKLQRKSADSSARNSTTPAFEETTFASRKLTKSDTNKVFFGVCAGLADYAGASPGLIRMIFALAFLVSWGTIFIPYFILALFLPGKRDR